MYGRLQAHGRRIRPSVLGRAGPAIVSMGVSAAKGDQSFMASRASGEMLKGRGKHPSSYRCDTPAGCLRSSSSYYAVFYMRSIIRGITPYYVILCISFVRYGVEYIYIPTEYARQRPDWSKVDVPPKGVHQTGEKLKQQTLCVPAWGPRWKKAAPSFTTDDALPCPSNQPIYMYVRVWCVKTRRATAATGLVV